MSRDLEDENYYISHGGRIPVKWTSCEVRHSTCFFPSALCTSTSLAVEIVESMFVTGVLLVFLGVVLS